MLYLAIETDETHKTGVRQIAEEIETPQPFLAKLLRQLTSNRLVSSTKGPGGGFYMDKDNMEKTLWDVISCIDGTHKFDQCFLGLSECRDENPCPVHVIVSPFKKKLYKDFKGKSIRMLAEEIKVNGTIITLKGIV